MCNISLYIYWLFRFSLLSVIISTFFSWGCLSNEGILKLGVRRISIDRIAEKSTWGARGLSWLTVLNSQPSMAGKTWWLEQLRPWWWEPLVCGSVNLQCGFTHMLEAQALKRDGTRESSQGPSSISHVSYPKGSTTTPSPKEHHQLNQAFKLRSPWGTVDSNFHAFCCAWQNTPPQSIAFDL